MENIIKMLTSTGIARYRRTLGGADGNSVIVQMPTGTGKTYVMASVVKWFIDNHETGRYGLLRIGVSWWSRCSRLSTDSAWSMARRKLC